MTCLRYTRNQNVTKPFWVVPVHRIARGIGVAIQQCGEVLRALFPNYPLSGTSIRPRIISLV